ncbi:MAG: DUF3276 family protein [Bacteroidaceae bacterium]|nr:DUF3276 family protein [Bacteroidaceae bacterium]
MKDNSYQQAPEKDIVYSKSIKAGKRIYYIDVKRNSKNELYLVITESKKTMVGGEDEFAQFNYERHKIFIYPEDFSKFTDSLSDVMKFIFDHQGELPQRQDESPKDIQIDGLEF